MTKIKFSILTHLLFIHACNYTFHDGQHYSHEEPYNKDVKHAGQTLKLYLFSMRHHVDLS